MPFCVGLTGGIGSGKSTVAELFRQMGAGIIDTDAISHALTQPGAAGLAAIAAAFGPRFLLVDGTLDRAALRAEIFSQPEAKTRLESILHPMIRQQVEASLATNTAPYVMLVVPLLIETGAYGPLLQRTLVVDCPEQEQVTRTMARSGLSGNEVRAIMSHQASRQARLSAAQDVIHNDGEQSTLAAQVKQLDQLYRRLAASPQTGD